MTDSSRDPIDDVGVMSEEETGADLLRPLMQSLSKTTSPSITPGVTIGELLAITDDGRTPLVRYPEQPGAAALSAKSTVDLHGPHIGSQVVLMFEGNDPGKPIVMGVLRGAHDASLDPRPGNVEIDTDGERMIVSAKEQLVLRCGKASITLTKEGKVLVNGTYLSSRSTGVNRIKGGSVQLN